MVDNFREKMKEEKKINIFTSQRFISRSVVISLNRKIKTKSQKFKLTQLPIGYGRKEVSACS